MILSKSNEPNPPPPMLPHMMPCPNCRQPVSRQAGSCPKCGHPINNTTGNLVWRVIFILIVVGGIAAIIGRLADL